MNKANTRVEKQVCIALRQKNKKFNFDGTTLKLALDSHNRTSLTFSTPKYYKIHQDVMLQLQYEYYGIF
jgi:hypothetical protein